MNDTELFQLVLEIDTQLIEQDISPYERPLHVEKYLNESLNFDDDFSAKINAIYKLLYKHSDLELPPMHVGAFMFRDVFFPMYIPQNEGESAINPVDSLLNVTDFQRRWLFDDKVAGSTFFDQFIDLMDFAYGLDDFLKSSNLEQIESERMKRTKELWLLAKRQLEAGASAILGSFDVYAVIQNSCVATELLLKGALVKETGMADDQLKKKYGHGIKKLVSAVVSILTEIDKERLLFAVDKLPDYADSRYYDVQDPNSHKYDGKGSSRRKIGELMMNTQFVAGEILRQFSDYNTRSMLISDSEGGASWNFTQRVFPSRPQTT